MNESLSTLQGYPLLLLESNHQEAAWYFGLERWWTQQPQAQTHALLLLWQTQPTLMLGRYQNPMQEWDWDEVRRRGITCVRRPSGGGTIFTDLGGWQFSFIHPDFSHPTPPAQTFEENAPAPLPHTTSHPLELDVRFAPYIQKILRALQTLGWPVTFSGRNDLLLNGKKISGNAQYHLQGFTIHHGSLLFSTDLETMDRVSRPPAYKCESKGIASVRERVMNLADALPSALQGLTAEQFRPLFLKTLLGLPATAPLPEHSLSPSDSLAIEECAKAFRGGNHLWQNHPPFTLEREGNFSGGYVKWALSVKNGRICTSHCTGDFFTIDDLTTWEHALQNCPYDRSAIASAWKQLPCWPFCDISPEELLSLIPETGLGKSEKAFLS